MVISKVMGIQDTTIENISGVDYTNVGEIYGVEASSPAPDTGTFSFDITIASADTFELPINGGGMGYVQDFTVDWGDTGSSTITAYNDTDRTHSYASAGTYTVVLNGTCEWFAFDDELDKDLIVELNSFTGDMQFEILNFNGCSSLTTAVALGTMASLKNATNMFRSCENLTAIPTGLFDGCSGMDAIRAFEATFVSCYTITSIPTDLFRYQPHITSNAFKNTFNSCHDLIEIPVGLFTYNTLVNTEAFYGTFGSCSIITTAPEDLFRYNIAITDRPFEALFASCVDLSSIPAGLFKYNTKITTYAFRNTFVYCYALSSIPADLFRYNILISTNAFEGTFASCTGLTSIVADLFRYNTAITTNSFYGTFSFCHSLATVSSGLFKYNTSALSFESTLSSCDKLQIISDLFCDAGDEGTRFLNQDIDFTNCFYRGSFTGTQGTAPDLWNYTMTSSVKTGCYGGSGNDSSSISNYASIPTAWL